MMTPLELAPLSPAQLAELDTCYRTTKDARRRPRRQMILLAAEQKRSAPRLAAFVREPDQTVGHWLNRSEAEGSAGLKSKPPPGPPEKVTPDSKARWLAGVRVPPRSLGQPYSVSTWARWADDLAEPTGRRVEAATVRGPRHAAAIVRSRPQHRLSRPAPEYAVKKRRLQTPGRP